MTFDIGGNLTTLGIIFLVLKCILPLIAGLVIAIVALVFARKTLREMNIDLSDRTTWASIAVVALAIALVLGGAL